MLVPAPLSMAALLAAPPPQTWPAGACLLRRGESAAQVLYLERGRVLLGVRGRVPGLGLLEHQLGTQTAPCWLDATAAVLQLPAAMDAVAETEVQVRAVPLATFRAALSEVRAPVASVLTDVAQAHRQQTELAVSRLAKDAEARCAEWLLNQMQGGEASKDGQSGVCTVQLQQRKRLIAAQLGIAPETLSRVLRTLRERGLISGAGRTLQLVDLPGLHTLAGA